MIDVSSSAQRFGNKLVAFAGIQSVRYASNSDLPFKNQSHHRGLRLQLGEHLYKILYKGSPQETEAAMLQKKLTQRQKVIFDFIRSRIEDRGFGPTIREIAEEMGFRSPNGVICHLTALQKKGLINRTNNKSRSIVLTDEVAEELNGFPLVGRVAAGALMEAIEQTERIDVAKLWPKKGTYVLEVEGDSMIEAQIASGDYVIVKRRHTADPGDIVVARVDGEATLKYWFPEKNRVRLQPANKRMKPIYSKKAKVIGVVVGVIRKY